MNGSAMLLNCYPLDSSFNPETNKEMDMYKVTGSLARIANRCKPAPYIHAAPYIQYTQLHMPKFPGMSGMPISMYQL